MPIRAAVSIVPLRDGASGLEVFVQHRRRTMDFAAGVVAYPGGRVDPIDVERADACAPAADAAHTAIWDGATALSFVESSGPLAQACAERGVSAAAVLAAAAIRELREETGAQVNVDALVPFANWTTPPGGTRRFDTFFYLLDARSVHLAHSTTEATVSQWRSTGELLSQHAAGTVTLMRPTLALLRAVDAAGSTAAALAEARSARVTPVRPQTPSAQLVSERAERDDSSGA